MRYYSAQLFEALDSSCMQYEYVRMHMSCWKAGLHAQHIPLLISLVGLLYPPLRLLHHFQPRQHLLLRRHHAIKCLNNLPLPHRPVIAPRISSIRLVAYVQRGTRRQVPLRHLRRVKYHALRFLNLFVCNGALPVGPRRLRRILRLGRHEGVVDPRQQGFWRNPGLRLVVERDEGTHFS